MVSGHRCANPIIKREIHVAASDWLKMSRNETILGFSGEPATVVGAYEIIRSILSFAFDDFLRS